MIVNDTDNQKIFIISSNFENKPIKFCYESPWKTTVKGDTVEFSRKMTLEELLQEYDVYLNTETGKFILFEKEYKE